MAKNYSDKAAGKESAPSKEELETPAPAESTAVVVDGTSEDQAVDVVKDEEQTPPTPEVKDPEPEKVKTSVRPKKITSEEQAVDYVRSFFKVPDGIKTVWVCEDTNIFYRGNPAEVHAKEQNLKLFAIRWD